MVSVIQKGIMTGAQAALLLVVLLVACSSAALAFQASLTPGTVRVDIQAGGYVSQPLDIIADAPVTVIASAPKSLVGLLTLTRHNATRFILHITPPYIDGNYLADGVLNIEIQGQQPLTSASAQHISIPVNVSINVNGKAPVPVTVDFGSEETVEIVPLSNEGATLLAIVIIGVIALNIVLRQRVKGKDNGMR